MNGSEGLTGGSENEITSRQGFGITQMGVTQVESNYKSRENTLMLPHRVLPLPPPS